MENINNKVERILKRFNAGDHKNAFNEFNNLKIDLNKNNDLLKVYAQMCLKLGYFEIAVKSFKKIYDKDKNNVENIYKLYSSYIFSGQFEKARKYIDKLLDIESKNFKALIDKSYVCFQLKDFLNADKFIKQALSISQKNAFALNIYSLLLINKFKFNEAIKYLSLAAKIDQKYSDTFNNLGKCYFELENIDLAQKYYKMALDLNPKSPIYLTNIGNILSLKDKYSEAIDHYKRAIAINQNNYEALSNLAICYCRNRDRKNAEKYFKLCIKQKKDDYELQYAYSTLLINMNEFVDAWKYFDSRLLKKNNHKIVNNLNNVGKNIVARINKKNLESILVLREQGIGEEILFSSVYSELIKNHKNIKIETDKRLIDIFNRSFKQRIFYEEGYFSNNRSKVDKFDKVIYSGSLLKTYRNSLKDFKNGSYLVASNRSINYFKTKLNESSSLLKVGISWKSVINIYGNLKSLSLEDFYPLFIKNRKIINLQYGDTSKEIEKLNRDGKKIVDFKDVDLFNDFDSCLGILKNIDIFITVSNTTAHLAGALGIPTIIICPKKSSTYFYWNLDKNNSIWYKNVRVVGLKKTVPDTIIDINNMIENFNDIN